MKTLIGIGLGIAVLALGAAVWMGRMSTNTAAGRFYKNDRWTWKTLVVEKDGFVHWLQAPSAQQSP